MRTGAGRRILVVTVAALALGACRDVGLIDKNLPLADARQRAQPYEVYTVLPAVTPVAVGGRHWVPAYTAEVIPATLLVPTSVSVEAAEPLELYVRRGARAPYSELYEALPDGRWRPYHPID